MFGKIEKYAAVLSVVAIVLMSFEIYFGSIILTFSMGTLSLLYFYAGLAYRKSTPKFLKNLALDENGNSLAPNIAFGYTWSAGMVGILFITQGYPGSDVMINVGLIGVLVGFGFSYLKYRDKTMEKLHPFFFRIVLITGIIGFFSVVPKKELHEFLNTNPPEVHSLELVE